MPAPASTDHGSRRFEGLAWSHELDLSQLLAAVGAAQSGDPGDEAAAAGEAAAMAAAAEAGAPLRDVTGVLADQLPPGPALAGCLSGADPAALSNGTCRVSRRRSAGWPGGRRPGSSPRSRRWRRGPPSVTITSAWTRTAARTRSLRRRGRRWAWSWSCPTRPRWPGRAWA